MSLRLEEIDSKNPILPLADFNNIDDPSFVKFVKEEKATISALLDEYAIFQEINMSELLRKDPFEYKDIRKKVNALVREITERKQEIWRRGHSIKESNRRGTTTTSQASASSKGGKGITELRKEVMKLKKEHNFHTSCTPYHMSKDSMIEWLQDAHKVIEGKAYLKDCPRLQDKKALRRQEVEKAKQEKKKQKEKGVIPIDDKYELYF